MAQKSNYIERDAFLQAMRSVANSVTVVTTDGDAGRYGATVSSFCSVSADPPTVLVCLNSASGITGRVAKNGFFVINVLGENDGFLADRFAGKHDADITDRFDGIALKDGDYPVFPDALALICEIEQTVSSGSHKICIGRVISAKGKMRKPLAYLDGSYRRVEQN